MLSISKTYNSCSFQENLHKIEEIYQIFLKDKIPFNPQTFALFFECIGRLPIDPENEELLKIFVDAMTQKVRYRYFCTLINTYWKVNKNNKKVNEKF